MRNVTFFLVFIALGFLFTGCSKANVAQPHNVVLHEPLTTAAASLPNIPTSPPINGELKSDKPSISGADQEITGDSDYSKVETENSDDPRDLPMDPNDASLDPRHMVYDPSPQLIMLSTNSTATIKKTVTPHIYYSVHTAKKIVALTFDDGPDSVCTPKILTILKNYNIKATFFIVGNKAQVHPEIVKRIAQNGHAIGNHTWDHHLLTNLKESSVRSEVEKTDQLLYGILGYHSTLVRPPYGSINPSQVKAISNLNYKTINWSVDTRDWAGSSVDTILGYVKRQVYPGGIILEHDTRSGINHTVDALPKIIEYLKSKDYKFVTIPQLLQQST